MEIFQTHKSCLVLFLLIFHCCSHYNGEALSPDGSMEGATTQQEQSDPSQDGENMPLLASPQFPIATNNNSPLVPSLNNRGQQPQPVYQQQQQLNYPQQSINQPFSGFTQPFSSINQPFLGVNQPYSSFNQPFGVSNQPGLTDNTLFDNGASKEKQFIIGIILVSLTTLMVSLGFIV